MNLLQIIESLKVLERRRIHFKEESDIDSLIYLVIAMAEHLENPNAES